MSPALAECPSLSVLEEVARGVVADPSAEQHALACDACRARLEEIARNNALMAELAAASKPTLSQPGDRRFPLIEGYEIQNCVGHGGQGSIYAAIQLATKRRVAIKVLIGGRFASPRQRNRFKREVELAAGLRHYNIVTVFDRGVTADGRQFCVMEYVEGASLAALIADDGSGGWLDRPIDARLTLFCKLCAAVEYAHRRGIIHRDLKPANILVDPADEPRIVDFGLAKALDTLDPEAMCTVTRPGEFAGTFAYASPEQTLARPDLIDTRTDVYSLGVTLFEMLTCRLPYGTAGPPAEVLRAVAEAPPRRPSEFVAGINDEIDTIVLKSLAKEPQRRYQSAGELLADIERYQSGRPIEAKRDSAWYVLTKTARRHRLAFGLAGLSVMLVASFAISMVFVARHLARQRDLAEAERHRADRNSVLFAKSMRDANIERGRAMSLAGNFVAAEEILWTEYLRPAASDEDRLLRSSAHWALREFHARNPCRMTADCDLRGAWAAIHPDRKCAVLCSPISQELKRLDYPSLLLSSLRLDSPDRNFHRVHAFTPDGSRLLTQGPAGTLRVWDFATGACNASFRIESGIEVAEFSPDGTLIAACDHGSRIWLNDAATGARVRTLDGHTAAATAAVFSPDGSQLASCGYDGTIRLWDPRTGACRVHYADAMKRPVWRVAYSPDGTLLAAIGEDFWLRIWDTTDGHALPSGSVSGPNPHRLRFSPDGRSLALASGGNIAIWDIATHRVRQVLGGHTARVTTADYLGDGDTLLTLEDEVLRVWNLEPNPDRLSFVAHQDSVLSASFSPDGARLASASADHSVRLWDAASGRALGTIPHRSIVECVVWSRSGLLATAAHERAVYLWNPDTLEPVAEIGDLHQRVNAMCFTPDGEQLFTASVSGSLQSWNAATRRKIRDFPTPGDPLSSLSCSPDGRLLAAGGKPSRSILLWDARTAEPHPPLTGHQGIVRCVQFSASGNLLASASDDQTVRLWDVLMRSCRATLSGTRARVYSVCFSPDDALLASCGESGEVRVWDVRSGRCLAIYQAAPGSLFGVDFSPDNDRFAAWGASGNLFIQDLRHFDRYIEGNRPYWESALQGRLAQLDPR